MGNTAVTGDSFVPDDVICKDPSLCGHPFLNKWDGIYICMDCWYKLNDTPDSRTLNADRIAREVELELNTPRDNVLSDMSEGKRSQLRDWNSWEIIRKIIKPATAQTRCRAVEIPEMADYVGPASTFISYAQAGKWGDLVAAVADGGADPNRCVWIDIFAIRQWPSDCPDLDFASTIENCSSFLVVCSYLEEVCELSEKDAMLRNSLALPLSIRKQICFMRVWCLVEAHKACTMQGMPIIMKGGSYALREDDGAIIFEPDWLMLWRLMDLVDISKAEATVESDKERILNDIVNGVGVNRLNSVIRGAIAGAYSAAFLEDSIVVQCAACGDSEPLKQTLSNPTSIFSAAASGYLNLLAKILDSGVDVNLKSDHSGLTALLYACRGGHEECAQFLLQNGADIHKKDNRWGSTALMMATHGGYSGCLRVLLKHGASVNDQDNEKKLTALMAASLRGHEECLELLLQHHADVNAKGQDGWTALMQASRTGHFTCVKILVSHGAIVDDTDEKGNTALMVASQNGHDECIKILLDGGSNINLKRTDGRSALFMAANKSFESCMRLLIDAGADVNAEDQKGYSVLEKATMQLLTSQGKSCDSSTRRKHLACAKLLRMSNSMPEKCRFFLTTQHPHPLIAREGDDQKDWFCDGAALSGAPSDCKGKLEDGKAYHQTLHKRNTCSSGCDFDFCECCMRTHYLKSMTFDEILLDTYF